MSRPEPLSSSYPASATGSRAAAPPAPSPGALPTADVLERILDADWLSSRAGKDVRAARLRVKPEVSVLMSLQERHTGHVVGWARILWPVSASKEDRTRRRLREAGRTLISRDLGHGMVMLLGQLDADPWLVTHLDRARERGVVTTWEPCDVLRYNPGRRLVLRHDDAVVRIRAGGADRGRCLNDIHRAVGSLVPVPRLHDPRGLRDDGNLSVQDRCGQTDLAACATPEGTRRAGAILAALHAGTSQLPVSLRDRLRPGPASPQDLAQAHASVLEAVAPRLAERVRAVGASMPRHLPGPPVLAHGDASPDQFLYDPPTCRTWVTDFDRVCLAPAATDLGSYLAVALPDHRQVLLEGYADAGGALPRDTDLEAAVALSRLSRLAEPLRHADPGWRQALAESLTRLEEADSWSR